MTMADVQSQSRRWRTCHVTHGTLVAVHMDFLVSVKNILGKEALETMNALILFCNKKEITATKSTRTRAQLTVHSLPLKMGIKFTIRHKRWSTLRTSHFPLVNVKSKMVGETCKLFESLTTTGPITFDSSRARCAHCILEHTMLSGMLKEIADTLEFTLAVNPFAHVFARYLRNAITAHRVKHTWRNLSGQQHSFAERLQICMVEMIIEVYAQLLGVHRIEHA